MDPNEELNRRLLKPIFVMAALEAFRRDARIVALREEQLSPLLGLEFFRDERFAWIERDAKLYFPHTTIVWRGKGQSVILLSRDQLSTNYTRYIGKKPLGPPLIHEDAPDWDRIQKLDLLWLELDQQGEVLKRMLQDFFSTLLGYT